MDGDVIRRHWREADPLPPEDWIALLPSRGEVETLYRAEAAGLGRFFRRRAPADDVADMVQETFRQWIRDIRAASQAIRPEAYLTAIAVNILRKRARTETRRAAALAAVEARDDRLVDPHAALEARDMLARVDTAIATLKPKTREIFLLHRIDGLDYAEIAERMEMSVKGVEWQMGQALDQIRRRVKRG